MKFRAERVMCVYASGNRVAEFLLRLKNARGRPRPPALDERSTSPFDSRTFRCFSAAILEIRSSCDMSESETAPRRFRVRRICFLADEKPASRPPASTSLTCAMEPERAVRYHIPIRIQNGKPKWEIRAHPAPMPRKFERGGGAAAPLRIKAEADCLSSSVALR